MEADDANSAYDLAKAHAKQLSDVWASVAVDAGTVATSSYQAISDIGRVLIDQLPRLAGARVLDIGCNSGLYSLLASRYVRSVTGCDVKAGYIARAEAAKKYFREHIHPVDNVRFVLGGFNELLTDEVDAIVVAKVLYHLGDQNIAELREFLSRGKKSVLIQARPQRAQAFKRHPEWHQLSVTKIYNGLYGLEDCLDFLRDCNFDKAEVTAMNVATRSEYFPVIFAERT